MRRSQAAQACDFDPSLLLDHTSIAVLQHLLRWVNTFPWSGRPPMRVCNYSALCLFAATMSCCTSRLRTCSPNTWSAFYWSSGRRQNGTLRVVCVLIVFIFFFRWQSPHRFSTQRVTGEGKLTGGRTGTPEMLSVSFRCKGAVRNQSGINVLWVTNNLIKCVSVANPFNSASVCVLILSCCFCNRLGCDCSARRAQSWPTGWGSWASHQLKECSRPKHFKQVKLK